MSEYDVRVNALIFWVVMAVCAIALVVMAWCGWLPGGGA